MSRFECFASTFARRTERPVATVRAPAALLLVALAPMGCAMPEDEGVVELVFRPAMEAPPVSAEGHVLDCATLGLALGPVSMFEAEAAGHDDHDHEHAAPPPPGLGAQAAPDGAPAGLGARPKAIGHGGDASGEVPEGLVGESVGRSWVEVAAGRDVHGVPLHVRVDAFAGDVDAELGDVEDLGRRVSLRLSCAYVEGNAPARVEGVVSLPEPAPIHVEGPAIWLRDGGTFVVEVDPSGAFGALEVAALPVDPNGVHRLEDDPAAVAAFVAALASSEALVGHFVPPE